MVGNMLEVDTLQFPEFNQNGKLETCYDVQIISPHIVASMVLSVSLTVLLIVVIFVARPKNVELKCCFIYLSLHIFLSVQMGCNLLCNFTGRCRI